MSLADQLERLAMDVATERHGSPHVIFAVLCSPDREPSIVVVQANRAPYGMGSLRRSKDDERGEGGGEPFPLQEFQAAHYALADADYALIATRYSDKEVGDLVVERVHDGWQKRLMAPIERELAAAEQERQRPATCPQCGRRFTERGLPMHLARSRFCSKEAS